MVRSIRDTQACPHVRVNMTLTHTLARTHIHSVLFGVGVSETIVASSSLPSHSR